MGTLLDSSAKESYWEIQMIALIVSWLTVDTNNLESTDHHSTETNQCHYRHVPHFKTNTFSIAPILQAVGILVYKIPRLWDEWLLKGEPICYET